MCSITKKPAVPPIADVYDDDDSLDQLVRIGRCVEKIVNDAKWLRRSSRDLEDCLRFCDVPMPLDSAEIVAMISRKLRDSADRLDLLISRVEKVESPTETHQASSSSTPPAVVAKTITNPLTVQFSVLSDRLAEITEKFSAQAEAFAELAARSKPHVDTVVAPSPPVEVGTVVAPSPPVEVPTPQAVTKNEVKVDTGFVNSDTDWVNWHRDVCKSENAQAILVTGHGKASIVNSMVSVERQRFCSISILTSSPIDKEKKRLAPFFAEDEVSISRLSVETLATLVSGAESRLILTGKATPSAVIVRMPEWYVEQSSEERISALFTRARVAGITLFVTTSCCPVFYAVQSPFTFTSIGLTAAAGALVRDAAYEKFFCSRFKTSGEFARAHATYTPEGGCLFLCSYRLDPALPLKLFCPKSTLGNSDTTV